MVQPEPVFSADAFLLGRKTYQIWAAFWPTATGDEELATRMNEIPKYVVSNTLTRADWANSTIFSGDVVSQIARLKERSEGDLLVLREPRPGRHAARQRADRRVPAPLLPGDPR